MKALKLKTTFLIIIFILIIAIPVAFLDVLNNGNPYTKYLVNKFVPTHLADKGDTTGIFTKAHYVEPKNLINKEFYHGHYMVIFKDERKYSRPIS